MSSMSLNQLKWFSTVLVLFGILLTNLNYYPLNIFSHGLGAVGWCMAGFIAKSLNKY